MDLNELVAKKIREQLGAMLFQQLLKDAQIEMLQEQIKTLEKKEDTHGI